MFDTKPFSAKGALRTPQDDVLRGRILSARKSGAGGARMSLGAELDRTLAGKKPGRVRSGLSRPFAVDGRQRVIAKVSFRNHGFGTSGGGGNLLAHASYLQRDGAQRENEQGRFYDERADEVADAREQLQDWAREDSRHFRITLAPESGARLVGEDGHLRDFTRETMARMERDLGVKLDWMGIDHHNTDNPHAHVIVRGVRRDGVDLILPRAYVSHGLREAARDVATERIGARGRDDERLQLEREAHARGLTRLDQAIEQDLGQRSEILLQRLGRGRDPAFADAMRARARELARIGLAKESRRNVIAFEPDWRPRLEAMRTIDVRRELAQARLYQKSMGRVAGVVRELGPRGETPDRGVLVLETADKGRLVLNTSMDAIADLQRGSLVALTPEGKRGGVERLSFHTPDEQARVWAQTELDRELNRLARGERARLPDTPGARDALEQRAQLLERHDFGVRSESGKFYFRDGALETLRDHELKHEGKLAAREAGGVFRDVTPGGGEAGFGGGDAWKVRETKELFAGKTAILERGRDVALAPIPAGMSLNAGDSVMLDLANGKQLEMTKLLGRGLGLDR